uniref:WAP domain-containing protein n=1 Tax=Sinocyclocheilus grahami TaxID=75366 RepID=A0A672MF36_SINGR
MIKEVLCVPKLSITPFRPKPNLLCFVFALQHLAGEVVGECIHAVKPGHCPQPKIRACAESCFHDGQCPATQKCCPTTCALDDPGPI